MQLTKCSEINLYFFTPLLPLAPHNSSFSEAATGSFFCMNSHENDARFKSKFVCTVQTSRPSVLAVSRTHCVQHSQCLKHEARHRSDLKIHALEGKRALLPAMSTKPWRQGQSVSFPSTFSSSPRVSSAKQTPTGTRLLRESSASCTLPKQCSWFTSLYEWQCQNPFAESECEERQKRGKQ